MNLLPLGGWWYSPWARVWSPAICTDFSIEPLLLGVKVVRAPSKDVSWPGLLFGGVAGNSCSVGCFACHYDHDREWQLKKKVWMIE